MKTGEDYKHTNAPEKAGDRDDRDMQDLFRHADVRMPPPPEIEQPVRETLHAQWRESVARRKGRRRVAALGLAASLAVVAVLINQLGGPGAKVTSAEPVAQIAKRSGSVLIQSASPDGPALAQVEAEVMYSGYVLETSNDSLLALEWHSGESIRVASQTRLLLRSAGEIELLSGQLYIDSGQTAAAGTGTGLMVRTHAGIVRHIGTQYLTSLDAAGVAVSVREGQVLVQSGANESVAEQGEQVMVAPDGATTTRQVKTYGNLWAWTETAAPAIDLDGKTVMEFLELVARESGRELAFDNAAAEDIARTSTLSGSVDLPAMRALDVVLQTTDLVANTENGRILILAK